MNADLNITKKDIFKYTLLPGVLPRLGRLGRSGFHNLAYLIASVFNALRILPDNHPYLRSDSIGSYGIIKVVAQAANHIEFNRNNWDKILVFFSILTGLVILAAQFILMLIGFLFSPALAASAMPKDYKGFFVTENHETDLVFKTLDRVFGIPDLFNSEVMTGGGPTPLNLALQALLEFYSIGLLFVGFFIIIYFTIAIVAETAQTGTPFGKRFSHVWAPIRLVFFFALLIPVTSGLNGGQILTLWAAKYGSGLATNGWLTYAEVLYGSRVGGGGAGSAGEGTDETLAGKKEEVIAEPNPPELSYLPGFMLLARTCYYVEKSYGNEVEGYVVSGKNVDDLSGAALQDILEKSKGAPVVIRFGVKNDKGIVDKSCGELTMSVGTVAEPGAAYIQNAYFDAVKEIWTSSKYGIDARADSVNRRYSVKAGNTPRAKGIDAEFVTKIAKDFYSDIEGKIKEAIKVQLESGGLKPDAKLKEYGWGGAAIWYNQIAKQNGTLTEAIHTPPKVSNMPQSMDEVRKARMMADMSISAKDMYAPFVQAGRTANNEELERNDKARILNTIYMSYVESGFRSDGLSYQTKLTGNAFIDTINLFLGTQGLFDLCKNTKIHPLAQMSSVGKTLIENAIRSVTISVFAGAAGGLASMIDKAKAFGDAGFAYASFYLTVAGIGIMIGFILFYVVPFMPFIYFFFAVADWVKGLFEAIVGVPLWALAHLRIDGQGLSGEAASGGYFLIFEVFIRPILIIAGLLAAVTIFSAMVKVLNEIFYLMVGNLAGNDPESTTSCFEEAVAADANAAAKEKTDPSSAEFYRGPIDEFFYTVIYAVVVYMTGMSSFKLIDMIPDNILRWLNAGVSGFSDKSGDPAQGLMKYVAGGGAVMGSKLQGGLKGAGENLQKALKSKGGE